VELAVYPVLSESPVEVEDVADLSVEVELEGVADVSDEVELEVEDVPEPTAESEDVTALIPAPAGPVTEQIAAESAHSGV
jgi:hypothetical protein